MPSSAVAPARWHACRTRARAEKQVARLLVQRGVESYLPLVARQRQWKDRQKLVQFPMFAGYVFGRFTMSDVHAVLSTPGVSTIVKTNGQLAAIAEEELNNVRRFAAALAGTGLEGELRPLLPQGERVRVREGPFEGVEGVVMASRRRRRVLVGIAALGQGLEIDIDVRLLSPVTDPR
ncbi:MAG: UpxY family transcription antiterminator [Longimicrobiales bacterium]